MRYKIIPILLIILGVFLALGAIAPHFNPGISTRTPNPSIAYTLAALSGRVVLVCLAFACFCLAFARFKR